jgi:FAD/FMN-containing dehydrogenase
MQPWSAGRVYANILGHDEADRVAEAYGPNYARLSQAKARFDPLNVFRVNQNITPSPAAAGRATLA